MKIQPKDQSEARLDQRKEEKEYLEIIMGSIDKSLQRFVKNRSFAIDHKNDKAVFFMDEPRQKGYTDHKQARNWYRAMPKAEFEKFEQTNAMKGDNHTGIAPYFDYCAGYINNNSDHSHLVEFRLNITGQALIDLIEQREKSEKGKRYKPHEIKPEKGTLSIGLGDKGFYWGTAGKVFNEMLAKRQIAWALIYFRIDLSDAVQRKVKDWKTVKGIS